MTSILLILAAALIGAAGFWLRGSARFHQITGRGATTARIVAWALPEALLSLLVLHITGSPYYLAAGIGVGLYLGSILGWWGSLDMGRQHGPYFQDFTLHTLRGVLWSAPVSLVLLSATLAGVAVYPLWWLPLVAGATCGVVYEIGYRLRPQPPYPLPDKFPNATEVGEAIFGALISVSIIVALLARAGGAP